MKTIRGWTKIPKQVLADARLSAAEKVVYVALVGFDFRNGKDGKGYVFPSYETLAKATALSTRTVQRAVVKLDALQYITKQWRGKNEVNHYIINVLPPLVDEPIQTVKQKTRGENPRGKGTLVITEPENLSTRVKEIMERIDHATSHHRR